MEARAKNRAWYPGETLITGIGQGYHQVTPLQLARATATLANKGNIVTPYLVEKLSERTKPDRDLKCTKVLSP